MTAENTRQKELDQANFSVDRLVQILAVLWGLIPFVLAAYNTGAIHNLFSSETNTNFRP